MLQRRLSLMPGLNAQQRVSRALILSSISLALLTYLKDMSRPNWMQGQQGVPGCLHQPGLCHLHGTGREKLWRNLNCILRWVLFCSFSFWWAQKLQHFVHPGKAFFSIFSQRVQIIAYFCLSVPISMNFWKSSKRPLTPPSPLPPFLGKMLRFFSTKIFGTEMTPPNRRLYC